MHSYILSQFNDDAVYVKISDLTGFDFNLNTITNNPDVVVIHPEVNTKTRTPKPSIKIDVIRELPKMLNRKPIKLLHRVVIIWQAETMTLAAQNAFLKVLEEPGEDNLIFLISSNVFALLPTIQSRCQILTPPRGNSRTQEDITDAVKEVEHLLNQPPAERLIAVEAHAKNRETASAWLTNIIHGGRTLLLGKQTSSMPELTILISNAQTALTDITHNLNPKLVLDHFVLSVQPPSGKK